MNGRIRRAEQPNTSKLPLLGKLKVGIKGDRFPKSLDYFVASGKYSALFDEVFKDKPKTIPIVFIDDNPANSCNERFECRDAQGRLSGYGDGKTFYIFNPDTEKYDEYNHEDEDHKRKIKATGKWEVILTITFIIPQIRTVFGQWTLTTKGAKSSVQNIRDTFDAVMDTAGTVRNIPFDLQVEKVKSQKPNSKNLFPVITLVPNISKKNLENLCNYIQSGNDIKKLGQLSNDKIEDVLSIGEPNTMIEIGDGKKEGEY